MTRDEMVRLAEAMRRYAEARNAALDLEVEILKALDAANITLPPLRKQAAA